MTATPSSEARQALEWAAHDYDQRTPQVGFLLIERAFIAGAEWQGAQVKMALIELRDYFRRHGRPQQEAIAIRALSGVESSDES